ncbi:MAG: HAD-IC family P-type ATPase, partial [Pseudorhizobium sp.]
MDIDLLQRSARPYLIALPVAGLLCGIAIRFWFDAAWAPIVWGIAALPVLAALLLEIALRLGKGDFGLDVIAALSISSALVFGEQLAALVVALMYAGGQYLEDFAQRRATREMTALLARAPRTALRKSGDRLEEVPIEAIVAGDRLSLRRGDVTPVDGLVCDGTALLDQSALTGEWMPVKRRLGEEVLSGSVNVGEVFDFTATRRAAESTYAGIVRLVEQARNQKAPMSRLADRYAVAFLIVTVAMALAAALVSGDPVRAVAVLVVATPCPLILAVPVALVAGISTAARQGILVKGAKALELMGNIGALVVDKTGTITT